MPVSPSWIAPTTASGPTQKSRLASKNASLTREDDSWALPTRRWIMSPRPAEPGLDSERLSGQTAEQHGAEDVQGARLAPRQREIHTNYERHQAEAGEHAPLEPLGQPAAGEYADECPGQDGRDVDRCAGHSGAMNIG